MKYLFSIEGNIGSGKSTILDQLKNEYPEYYYLPEPVGIWDTIKDVGGKTILEKYYINE